MNKLAFDLSLLVGVALASVGVGLIDIAWGLIAAGGLVIVLTLHNAWFTRARRVE